MHKLLSYKKFIFGALLAIVVGIFSVAAWSQQGFVFHGPTLSAEYIPSVPYHEGKPTVFVPYLEDGVLYLSEIEKYGPSAGSEVSKKKVAEGVIYLFGVNENTGQFLYQALADAKTIGGNDVSRAVLWIGGVDGKRRELYRGAGYSTFSPSGTRVVLSDDKIRLHIIDLQGNDLAIIGEYGTQAVFSPDGTKIAYHKLSGAELGSSDVELGVVVYDLATGKEYTVTPDHGSYGLVSFSSDGTKFYYLRERQGDLDLAGMDRVDFCVSDFLGTKKTTRLTGAKKLPYLFEKTVKSSVADKFYWNDAGEGVIFLEVLPDGKTVNIDSVAKASDPFFLDKGKTLVFRKKDVLGNKHWQLDMAQ